MFLFLTSKWQKSTKTLEITQLSRKNKIIKKTNNFVFILNHCCLEIVGLPYNIKICIVFCSHSQNFSNWETPFNCRMGVLITSVAVLPSSVAVFLENLSWFSLYFFKQIIEVGYVAILYGLNVLCSIQCKMMMRQCSQFGGDVYHVV